MFANWNKRMNDYSTRWKEYIQKMIINNENKNGKNNPEGKKNEEIKKNENVDLKNKNENVDLKNKNENEINKKDMKRKEKNVKGVEKDNNKINNNKMEDEIKIKENKMKFENDKKSALINEIGYHQQIDMSNIIKIKNNTKNKENNGRKNNKIIRSKIKLVKRSIEQWIYDFDKDKLDNVKFYYKKNNILNINELYDINIDEKVYYLKEISYHLIDPYARVCDFDEETFFDKKIDIEIKSYYEYKEFIIELKNLLLKLKDKDEINIILHIIDTRTNLYITQKYKNKNSKLKEKDKWLYYDDSGWGNLVPRKEFNKEEFINEFTYAYEDI